MTYVSNVRIICDLAVHFPPTPYPPHTRSIHPSSLKPPPPMAKHIGIPLGRQQSYRGKTDSLPGSSRATFASHQRIITQPRGYMYGVRKGSGRGRLVPSDTAITSLGSTAAPYHPCLACTSRKCRVAPPAVWHLPKAPRLVGTHQTCRPPPPLHARHAHAPHP